ncbi:MAG TPA: MerR family transcriptional regulator [Roseiflexaceae bacterium]|nr:MerR family transcriptional regulator [Roseiflexaceae bacterium]
MIVSGALRTKDLAHAAQVGVQQVRNYEASGLIPPATRGSNGYRQYTRQHLVALTTVQHLIAAYGVERARRIMQSMHAEQLANALALIDEHHAWLAGQRAQLEQTLSALTTLAAQPPTAHMRHTLRLRVGEAAHEVGVRVSAVHFWERHGLLQPVRDKSSRYRLYDEGQMRRLRVVALLRAAGYDFPAIRTTLQELAAGRPEHAIAAIEQRRAELTRRSLAALAAASAFLAYVEEFWPEFCAG